MVKMWASICEMFFHEQIIRFGGLGSVRVLTWARNRRHNIMCRSNPKPNHDVVLFWKLPVRTHLNPKILAYDKALGL